MTTAPPRTVHAAQPGQDTAAMMRHELVRIVEDVRGRTGRRPLIGLTAPLADASWGAWQGESAAVLSAAYLEAITEAGARPVLLPPVTEWSDEELEDLDGIVLTGGGDLDPETLGLSDGAADAATPRPAGAETDTSRDDFELDLYRRARRLGLPVLAICRGLQVVNVAHGGTLLQELSEDLPAYPDTVTGGPVAVDVEVVPGSSLAGVLPALPSVQAFHHQGIGVLGQGLVPTAFHRTGLVEAVETTDGGVLGVQWHPERTPRQHALFALFTNRARLTRAQREELGRTPSRDARAATRPAVVRVAAAARVA
jgi:putative glutamine amidotransferase